MKMNSARFKKGLGIGERWRRCFRRKQDWRAHERDRQKACYHHGERMLDRAPEIGSVLLHETRSHSSSWWGGECTLCVSYFLMLGGESILCVTFSWWEGEHSLCVSYFSHCRDEIFEKDFISAHSLEVLLHAGAWSGRHTGRTLDGLSYCVPSEEAERHQFSFYAIQDPPMKWGCLHSRWVFPTHPNLSLNTLIETARMYFYGDSKSSQVDN